MPEGEKGRMCPRTKKWCPDCTYTCKVDGLIAWVQDLSVGNDSFKYEPSEEQIENFLKETEIPPPDPNDDKGLDPFKEKFGDYLQ